MHAPRRKDTNGAGAGGSSDLELVGRSEAFIEVMKQMGRVAAANLPVLITGESGAGKELVARAAPPQPARRLQVSERLAVAEDLSEIDALGSDRLALLRLSRADLARIRERTAETVEGRRVVNA